MLIFQEQPIFVKKIMNHKKNHFKRDDLFYFRFLKIMTNTKLDLNYIIY